MISTIQLHKKTKKKLDKLKVHNRETYNELILRLLEVNAPMSTDRENLIETIEVLSDPELMRGISEALAEKEGISLEALEKELEI